MSEDIRVILEDICECLSVTYRRPEMFVATIWLSVYDVTLSTIYMFDVHAIYYFSFLRKEDKTSYQSMLNTIYSHHKLSDEFKTCIGAHQNELKWKNYPENYCIRKENSLIHEQFFLGVASNEKIRKNILTGRTCNL